MISKKRVNVMINIAYLNILKKRRINVSRYINKLIGNDLTKAMSKSIPVYAFHESLGRPISFHHYKNYSPYISSRLESVNS